MSEPLLSDAIGSASAKVVTKFQKFTSRDIDRSQIKNASYNPRVLSDKAKKKLRESLKHVGLVQPITWNERTGNIVGGHQRVSILDSLEGGSSYRMTVAVVDVDEKTEKKLNIFLNNQEAQGDWDLDKLTTLLKEVEIDGTGFDMADVYQLFGEGMEQHKDSGLEAVAEQLRVQQARYKDVLKTSNDRNDSDFYCVVVFRNNAERNAFTSSLGLDDNRYVDGRTLVGFLPKKETPADPVKEPEPDVQAQV